MFIQAFNTSSGGIFASEISSSSKGFKFGLYNGPSWVIVGYDGSNLSVEDNGIRLMASETLVENGDPISIEYDTSSGEYRVIHNDLEIFHSSIEMEGSCCFKAVGDIMGQKVTHEGFSNSLSAGAKNYLGNTI